MDKPKSKAYRQVAIIFVVLVILTIAEFFVATELGSAIFLILLAFAKAGLIVYFYMHIYRLWREEEAH
ncbi:MAG: cytochrome C oxidase subunit IV family protein [Candidatus Promineifilaceae bacterium]|nr:cytochrome C oxidase subunit IV family protein [Candidatus Promineifilaceae bacterium]